MGYRALITLKLPTFNEVLDFCVRLDDNLGGADEIVQFLKEHSLHEGVTHLGKLGEETPSRLVKFEFRSERQREEWGGRWADKRWTVVYSHEGKADVRQHHA